MIKSFKCEETEKIFNRQFSKKLPHSIQKIAIRKLWMVDAAFSINDLRIPPSNHLELLYPKTQNRYSIRVNKQWRLCFRWSNGSAFNLEIIDYH